MNKKMMIIFCIFLCMGFASTSFGGSGTFSEGVLTISDGTTGDLTFGASPSTDLHAFTSDTAYAITSASTKTTTDNGIEYGILSSEEGYYQRAQAASYNVTDCAEATALPGTNWKDKNGNTIP